MSAALILGALFAAPAFAEQSAPAPEAAGGGKQNWDGVYDKERLVAPAHWSTAAIKYLSKLGYCDYFDESMIEEGKNFRLPKKTGTAKLAVQAYGTMREKLNEEEPVPFEAWLMLGALGAEYQSEIRTLGHIPNDMAILAYAQMPEKAEGTHVFTDVPDQHWLMIILDMVFEDFGTKMRHAGSGGRTLTRYEVAMLVHRIIYLGLYDSKRKTRMDSGQLYVLDILIRELSPGINDLTEHSLGSNVPDIRSYLRSRPEFPKLI